MRMANCPKCGKRLAAWGNCLHCGYKDGDPVTDEERKEAEKQVEKTKNSESAAWGIIIALIVVGLIYFLATSTLQVNITGTIKVQ